jgi:prepilin-type processing-associated H-X9-DG protein
MYSGENRDFFPEMQTWLPGFRDELLGVDIAGCYPEYLTDPFITKCSSDSDADSSVWGQSVLDLGDGKTRIESLIQSGQANANCMVAHLSFPRSYVYFGWATDHGSSARLAWKCLEYSNEGVRSRYGLFGEAGGIETLRVDLGSGCPYDTGDAEGAWYNDDSDVWYGFYRVPGPVRIQYGAAGAYKGRVVLTQNGDALTSWASTQDRYVSESHAIGPDTLYRLREGIERFFITDINNPAGGNKAQSGLPIMMDVWAQSRKTSDDGGNVDGSSAGVLVFNHVPGGSNVLYMDGHVEFVRYGTQFPVIEYDEAVYGGDISNGSENIGDGTMG